MATVDEIMRRWEARRAEGEQLGAMVPLARVAADVLASLRELSHAGDDVLTIQEAAAASGYSEDHLRRMIAEGRIPNAGRRNKPGILRSQLPRKPGYVAPLPGAGAGDQLSARRRIVTDATHAHRDG